MNLKTLRNGVTSKVGRQVLFAKKHSPTALFAVGTAGAVTSVFLACRATLKLNDVLEESEDHLKRVDVTITDEDTKEEVKAAHFGVRVKTATTIAKLYAPSAILLGASLAAVTGSHIILRKRNMALSAAYAIVHKSYGDYRARVIEDQGAEKDFEYRAGMQTREIAEEGPNGLEVTTVKGPSQKALKDSEVRSYARVFDRSNPNWSDVPHQNQYFLQMVQNNSTDLLRRNGSITLNDVYDQLGFKRSAAGQLVGWVYAPKRNPETGEIENDQYVDFGTWQDGMYQGKQWVDGSKEAFWLDFNVDGPILDVAFED